MTFLTTLIWLLVAHAFADYVFQSAEMGKRKNPNYHDEHTAHYGPWWWSMSAHALVNAGGVLYVTQNVWLAMGEGVVHFLTDWAKCTRRIGTNQDQGIHLLSKVVWAVLA